MKKTKIFYGNQYVESFYTTGKKNVLAMHNAKSIQKYNDRQVFYAGLFLVGLLLLTAFITL